MVWTGVCFRQQPWELGKVCRLLNTDAPIAFRGSGHRYFRALLVTTTWYSILILDLAIHAFQFTSKPRLGVCTYDVRTKGGGGLE